MPFPRVYTNMKFKGLDESIYGKNLHLNSKIDKPAFDAVKKDLSSIKQAIRTYNSLPKENVFQRTNMLNSIDALTTRVENKINSHPTDFFSAVKCHSRPTNRIGLFHLDTRKAESNYLDVVIDEVRFNIAEERKEVAEIKQNKTTRASENKSNLYKLKEMLGKIAGKGGNKQEQEQRQEEEQKQNNNLKF